MQRDVIENGLLGWKLGKIGRTVKADVQVAREPSELAWSWASGVLEVVTLRSGCFRHGVQRLNWGPGTYLVNVRRGRGGHT